ncbi:Lecithin:cholesterol/phospholipid:diacylglycerol acyltransferase [Thamnocephalis sphaerospora]|uniref:Lecithin:cholesterol/phospholipid:diacylglycerol acyltransferase n=1 Tax=Thamnocephalis sphaerospora TaxID=78915 RepID=A0A4P9XN11_9FUNG|nr:Lecithin:cholesterol/phospholipid:diacylglycerol acyltransferase [Thamnocephalis sphaerospora]|eukprot:RKP07295.1 Lecithin:cholesterol/phospholipid:diacylglycerol acyltransferase [Thamnocephalis sphaerospora]
MAAEEGLTAKHPVILVPGIISTGLENWGTSECSRKYFRHRMWGTVTMFRAVLLDKDCWTEHMRLDPDTGLDPPGVKLRAAQGLDAADYFIAGYWVWGKIIENLAAIGYDSNNMYLAAYDWRLGLENLEKRDLYLSKLKSMIELAKRADDQKVMVVAHSMGAGVFYYFLKWVESPQGGNGGPTWVNDHLETFVNLAGPMLGVPKTVASLVSGEMRDTVQPMGEYVLERFYSRSERAALFRTWGGLHSMIPKGGDVVWGDAASGAPDDPLTGASRLSAMLSFRTSDPAEHVANVSDEHDAVEHAPALGNLTLSESIRLIRTYGGSRFAKLLDAQYSFGVARTEEEVKRLGETKQAWSNPLESALPDAPDMKIYCLYGYGKETERGYVYTTSDATTFEANDVDENENAVAEGLGKVPHHVRIDRSVDNESENIDNGVFVGEGDGTVPLLSLGYMCVDGWRIPRYNPAGIPVYTREYLHRPASIVRDLRGGAGSAEHVDILGNAELTVGGGTRKQAERRIAFSS